MKAAISKILLVLFVNTISYAEPSISPMLFFLRNTENQFLLKSAHSHDNGYVPVTVRFDKPPDKNLLNTFENHGLFLKRHNGTILHSEHIYPATIHLGSLEYFRNSPEIVRIESTFRPSISPTLNVSNPQVQASSVWDLKVDNIPVDGSGVIIANIDTGIDIFHPGFFKPDAGTYEWLDVNNSGFFEDGIDCVDLNGNGLPDPDEKLSFYDASFSDPLNLMQRSDGIYDADIDWLYNDANNNGIRDFGPDGGFSESDPSFGELIFVLSDDNKNNSLDLHEKLVGLGTSRILAIIDADGIHQRGENLFTNTGDIHNHGTGSSGIVGGQSHGRRLTGMAPGVEFICINHPETEIEEGVLIARDLGADIFMYEFGNWMFEFLDGSSNLETLISDLHKEGFPQFTAAGNLAGPKRKKHVFVPLEQSSQETINFSVPESGIKYVFLSILWRGLFIKPSITLYLNTSDSLPVTGDEKEYTFGDLHVISGTDTSQKETSRMDIIIFSEKAFDGEMSLVLLNKNRFSPLDIDAYIADDVTHWMHGAQFQDFNFITDDGTVCSPGTAENDITVGAYDPRGTRNEKGAINDFSSWGKTIDGRRAVDITAPGTLVYSLSSHYSTGNHPGGYIDFGGTSSSLPHVVGCAALLKQIIPDISSYELSEILYKYTLVDDFTGPVPNDVWGFGKLRVYDSITLSNIIKEYNQPVSFNVSNSYPNPFNSVVNFDITSSHISGPCRVDIFNLLGQKISSYDFYLNSPGYFNFRWHGKDKNNYSLPSGIYFFQFVHTSSSVTRKALLLK